MLAKVDTVERGFGGLTEQVLLIGIELGELPHLPSPGPHDGLHQGCDLLQHEQSILLARQVPQVREIQHQGFVFGHFGDSVSPACSLEDEWRMQVL